MCADMCTRRVYRHVNRHDSRCVEYMCVQRKVYRQVYEQGYRHVHGHVCIDKLIKRCAAMCIDMWMNILARRRIAPRTRPCMPIQMPSALYRHRRRHVHCAGMGVPSAMPIWSRCMGRYFHFWYKWLDQRFVGTTLAAIAPKLALELTTAGYCHSDIGRNFLGRNCVFHDCICRNCIGNNY